MAPTAVTGRVIARLLLLALLATGTACTQPSSPSAGPTSSDSSTSIGGSQPPGTSTAVTAVIDQFRDNYATYVIQIQLSNTGSHPVTVESASLSTGLFTGPTQWNASPGGTEIPPGQTKSLPAQLPSPACKGPSNSAPDGARVNIQLKGDAPLSLTADDPHGVLARNNSELCLEQEVAAVVHLELSGDFRADPVHGTAILRLNYVPQGRGGSITIDEIQGTTLISEDRDAPWPKGTELSGSGTSGTIELTIRPTRCDPHAVAEDKVGTLLPLNVRAGNRTGIIKVPADTSLKAAIQEFVGAACRGGQQ